MTKKNDDENPRIEARDDLKDFGSEILENIKNTEPPRMKVPSRSTSNIVYDEDEGFYTLAGKKSTRTAANMRQVKKFAQTMCAADFCKDLINSNKDATLREMYYTSEGWPLEALAPRTGQIGL